MTLPRVLRRVLRRGSKGLSRRHIETAETRLSKSTTDTLRVPPIEKISFRNSSRVEVHL